MLIEQIPQLLAIELKLKPIQVEATIKLLEEGNTIPFIARYRKEITLELDEENIRLIDERNQYLKNLVKRQEDILASILAQEKLTPELEAAIKNTTKLQDLEDLYLPYKPKKRTRAQIAREKGLEPLAELIFAQNIFEGDILALAAPFVDVEKEVNTSEEALALALDIIAEKISESAEIRATLRKEIWLNAELVTDLIVSEEEGKDVLSYKEYHELIKRMPSHRILAVNRGEDKKLLKVSLSVNNDHLTDLIARKVITGPSIFTDILKTTLHDSYKRLLFPSLERELRTQLTENAEKQAIKVFGLNLKQLLLQPPLSGHTVMGLDPGYRTGCKMAVVSPTGTVLAYSAIYLTFSDAKRQEAADLLLELIKKHNVTLISIGNGTASYETEEFVANLINEHNLSLNYLITNEAGASVYSASKLAKEEMPDLDVTIRGAVSIARRVQDPLAELVKIDPKSIGVGQYQHDVNQKDLSEALVSVVESGVNHVGVELNTASAALLQYIAGINASVSKNIVNYRNENGPYKSRKDILKVPRLGPSAFTQCAGFLRILGAKNPLDNTPVHPESYNLAETILKRVGYSLKDLNSKEALQEIQEVLITIDAKELATELEAGEPTVRDIIAALIKPGRDPREDLPKPITRKNIVKLSDIQIGTVVKGTVHNVTDFGAFIDIGIKTNGLIHRSELSYKPFRHPIDVISVGDIIDCMVISIDEARNRIGLSLKQVPK